MGQFDHKVIVITGAGGVLCSAFAKELARCGAKVALLNRHVESAQAVADEIAQNGGTAKAYRCDVLCKEDLIAVRDDVHKTFGLCDILINGAGGNHPSATAAHETYQNGDETLSDVKTFFNLDKADFDSVFGLNLMGTLLPTQVFSPDMIHRNGTVLNVSSMNAFRPLTKIPAYSAAKAAVSNFTQWLAVHFADAGIRVNAMAPGFFVTKQNKDLLFRPDGTPTPRTEKILAATPMKRFGKPEELLGALRFLCDSRESAFVTGIVLPIDGGFSAYSGV